MLTMGLRASRKVRAELARYAADPGGPTEPERTTRLLAAFNNGDQRARSNVNLIAAMLRAEGRIAELAQLQDDLLNAANTSAWTEASAGHEVVWNVLAIPGMPAAAVELAAKWVVYMLAHIQPPQWDQVEREGRLSRDAALHTLAVARLRQGRYAEVEPICALLRAITDPGNRATVLATVALARRALGQPCEDLLAQAVALDPAADLVQEALADASGTQEHEPLC